MSIERHFLGWDGPFMEVGVEWLLEQDVDLGELCVVVPTAQAGRRLREELAVKASEAACILLPPRVVTPGAFLRGFVSADADEREMASEVVELLAWVEVLEAVDDWSEFVEAFPQKLGVGESPGWSVALAKSLVQVRRELVEAGVMMAGAAIKMAESETGAVEAGRWEALAKLESRVESFLGQWGYISMSRRVAFGEFDWEGFLGKSPGGLVLFGMTDLSGILRSLLRKVDVKVVALVGAPASEAAEFDEFGRPQMDWGERHLEWPSIGGVHLCADAGGQAEKALRLVAEGKRSSGDVLLGTGDEEVAGELVRVFEEKGWALYDPGQQMQNGLARWLAAWARYMREETVQSAIELLAFPEMGRMVRGRRAQRVVAMSRLKDSALVRGTADVKLSVARAKETLQKTVESGDVQGRMKHQERELENAELALETMEALAKTRAYFLKEGFVAGLGRLGDLAAGDLGDGWVKVEEFRDLASELMERSESLSQRPGAFWLDLLLGSLGNDSPAVPEGRVLDVLGWMELFFERGRHLLVCGMNEGMIPERASSDTWLPEATRRELGLMDLSSRAARDGFLLRALIEARGEGGRVDLILGKGNREGEVYKPSRLLLQAKGEELGRRVKELFKEVPPADAGEKGELEEVLKWRAFEKKEGSESALKKLSATKFKDYLACPFRFYLKHIRRMQEPEPNRVELNARDFGTLAHEVLESFGLDEEARRLADSEAIFDWASNELDRMVTQRFAGQPPVAVRIQLESLRQRLKWFAVCQAEEVSNGWLITEVEKDFSIKVGGFQVTGEVDRIEVNEADGRMRILDYKTGWKSVESVVKAHLVGERVQVPLHLEEVDEVWLHSVNEKGKELKYRWVNLQLPLYAEAMKEALGADVMLGYFGLGKTEEAVCVDIWEDFSEENLASARGCAEWVVGQITEEVFWPPAEKLKYDDYSQLSPSGVLEGGVIAK